MTEALVCPFCRQRYEGGTLCLQCDIELVSLSGSRPSTEEKSPSAWPDDYVARSLTDLRNARGPLLLIIALSLGAFYFLPWLSISAPYEDTRSGFAMASGRLGWLWGGAMGWMLSGILVFTQRSPFQMRKLRPLLVVLAAMTVSEVGLLLAIPPTQSPPVKFVYQFAWGIYASLGLALMGCVFAMRFGGTRHRESKPRSKGLSDYPPPENQSVH